MDPISAEIIRLNAVIRQLKSDKFRAREKDRQIDLQTDRLRKDLSKANSENLRLVTENRNLIGATLRSVDISDDPFSPGVNCTISFVAGGREMQLQAQIYELENKVKVLEVDVRVREAAVAALQAEAMEELKQWEAISEEATALANSFANQGLRYQRAILNLANEKTALKGKLEQAEAKIQDFQDSTTVVQRGANEYVKENRALRRVAEGLAKYLNIKYPNSAQGCWDETKRALSDAQAAGWIKKE